MVTAIRRFDAHLSMLTSSIGKLKQNEETELGLSFKVCQNASWIARSDDGSSAFVIETREYHGPWNVFPATISDLLSPERLDRLLWSTISQLGLPNRYANHLRVKLLSFANEKAREIVNKRPEKMWVTVRIMAETEYWMDESWMIDRASMESEILNDHRGFGAVPATDFAIASALSIKNFKNIGSEETNEACMICLEDFHEDAQVNQLPCFHFFHRDCIINWLRQSNCCPICRYKLQANA